VLKRSNELVPGWNIAVKEKFGECERGVIYSWRRGVSFIFGIGKELKYSAVGKSHCPYADRAVSAG
jgi:hypothetical protein